MTEEEYSLPEVKVGHWGGFIFINPDPDCEPLEDFLGDIDRHFGIPFERRYKAAHLIKRLPCNWKIAQEAFMESYHVIATHPELLGSFGDVNSKYDVFETFRAQCHLPAGQARIQGSRTLICPPILMARPSRV